MRRPDYPPLASLYGARASPHLREFDDPHTSVLVLLGDFRVTARELATQYLRYLLVRLDLFSQFTNDAVTWPTLHTRR